MSDGGNASARTELRREAWHFVLFALLAGGSLALLFEASIGRRFGSPILVGFVVGLGFGVLFSLVLATGQAIGAKLSGRGAPLSLSPRQLRERQYPGDVPHIGNLAWAALLSLPAEITVNDSTRGHLQAKTRINWRTYGEIITVDLAAIPGGAQVRVQSRPRWRMTLVDYGRGLDNVWQVTEYIEGALAWQAAGH